MRVTMLQYMEAARVRGHDLNSLICLAKKFPEFNTSMEIAENQRVIAEFSESGSGDMLSAMPGASDVDILDLEQIKKIADERNSQGKPWNGSKTAI